MAICLLTCLTIMCCCLLKCYIICAFAVHLCFKYGITSNGLSKLLVYLFVFAGPSLMANRK